MTIIHIVTNIERINFGIWNAALLGARYLRDKEIATSELWVCHGGEQEINAPIRLKLLDKKSVDEVVEDVCRYSASSTIVVTHGCWGKPTIIGARCRKKGYSWIYTPHGMLEPWSMQQKYFKKRVYFSLIERRLASKASLIRSVSDREKDTLKGMFTNDIVNIYNGVYIPPYEEKPKSSSIVFLFLARLHHKKGVYELVKAWSQHLSGLPEYKLIIAGPDDGELSKIRPFIRGNIEYVGAVYNKEKIELLRTSNYYILPSKSEGFPTSVVEAMSYGMIPIISSGCNFPQVFTESLGYETPVDINGIASTLKMISKKPWDSSKSHANYQYIKQNFSDDVLGDQLLQVYRTALLK